MNTPTIHVLTMRFPHESALDQLYIQSESGDIIATVTVRTRTQTVEFHRLFVHADHRRKGLGKALVSHVVNAAGNNVGAQGVSCMVNRKNTEAIAFYRALGFFAAREDADDFTMSLQVSP